MIPREVKCQSPDSTTCTARTLPGGQCQGVLQSGTMTHTVGQLAGLVLCGLRYHDCIEGFEEMVLMR